MISDKKIKPKAKEAEAQDLKAQTEELTDKWKRTVADYRNLEMRMDKEKEKWIRFGNQGLLFSLLEIVDDLERAVSHVKDSGLEMILEKFRKVLINNQVEEIKGDEFDPELMECVEMVKGEKNKILSIEQKGYLFHGRLLRPAKVKVGKGK